MPSFFPGCEFKKTAREFQENFNELDTIPFDRAVNNLKTGAGISLMAELALENEGKPAEIEIIKGMGTTSFIGASDTTMSAISTVLLILTLHPDVQAKGQAEIDGVVGRDRLPTFEDRKSLPYVQSIYREIMRLHPAVPVVDLPYFGKNRFPGYWATREALKQYIKNQRKYQTRLSKAVVSGRKFKNSRRFSGPQPAYVSDGEGNQRFEDPSGDEDLVGLGGNSNAVAGPSGHQYDDKQDQGEFWAMNRDPNVYSEPDKFIPERFFNSASGPFTSINEIYAYGFGRRVCVGRYMADNTAWLTIVYVLATLNLRKAKDGEGKEIDIPGEFTQTFFRHPKPYQSSITPRDSRARELMFASPN
ncbi:cytochrome P450 [Rhodocollybia butyracea]|uniref:Cytochrome P450 n=1 Tax=Rhodocollybia butyracea TaxID=206335 RepID=A0A9P5PRR0_9AGAR|nr:cytochrome P450 [Rhodocollybia butyracea]